MTNEYQDRVRVERHELGEKLVKLQNFLETDNFRALSPRAQNLLKQQFTIMAQYHVILSDRINDFSAKVEIIKAPQEFDIFVERHKWRAERDVALITVARNRDKQTLAAHRTIESEIDAEIARQHNKALPEKPLSSDVRHVLELLNDPKLIFREVYGLTPSSHSTQYDDFALHCHQLAIKLEQILHKEATNA